MGGISMGLPMGQPPQVDASAFPDMGQHVGFAPDPQMFNGNNAFFPPANMMFPPNQHMMTDTNGTGADHAVNGNAAISAGK